MGGGILGNALATAVVVGVNVAERHKIVKDCLVNNFFGRPDGIPIALQYETGYVNRMSCAFELYDTMAKYTYDDLQGEVKRLRKKAETYIIDDATSYTVRADAAEIRLRTLHDYTFKKYVPMLNALKCLSRGVSRKQLMSEIQRESDELKQLRAPYEETNAKIQSLEQAVQQYKGLAEDSNSDTARSARIDLARAEEELKTFCSSCPHMTDEEKRREFSLSQSLETNELCYIAIDIEGRKNEIQTELEKLDSEYNIENEGIQLAELRRKEAEEEKKLRSLGLFKAKEKKLQQLTVEKAQEAVNKKKFEINFHETQKSNLQSQLEDVDHIYSDIQNFENIFGIKEIVLPDPEETIVPDEVKENISDVPETIEEEHKVSKYCYRCGNKLPEGSLFCNICGTKVI